MASDNKIGIKDMISLALKGWSKEDIKDLISMAEAADSGKTNEEPQAGTGDPAPADPEAKQEPEKETEPKKAGDAIDYKSLYEQSQKELAAAQEANRKQDSPEPDPDEGMNRLKEVFASFM